MGRPLIREQADLIPNERWAIRALAQHFACADTPEAVFAAAFDWYYIPRCDSRKDYAKRVVEAALCKIKESSQDPYPDWFWRVYELLITKENTLGSIPPPPDPK